MKIKELHIRNIASIERADIDFEKDLIDAETGLPASMFLISGDTGAGKSVILDSISMALYGTTPRIKSITGRQNNEFRNADGQTVKVYSIEQYTRLGITEKDDCYSEVVFEGNDGLEYRSRFKLGVFLGNTDKATGKRYLKPRNPVMSVTVGTETFTGDDAYKKIEAAVGLSFEQFGRMAMLAQGQFAAFLTGEKKERESILEQLTNTEHFSRYGEAIKSLYDKAKAANITAQVAYNTEKEHTLPQETVDALKEQLEKVGKEKEANDGKVRENGRRLDEINKYEAAVAAIRTASEQKQKLKEAIKGEEYVKAKALAADWENTVTERQRLADRRAAEKNLDEAQAQEKALANAFRILDADLAFQKQQVAAREETLKEKRSWLEARKDRDLPYSHVGETLLMMENYESVLAEMSSLTEKQALETGKTKGLVAAAAEKNLAATDVKKAVDDKQNEIDALIKQRDALDPQKTNEDLGVVRNKISALGLLLNEIKIFAAAQKAYADLSSEVEGDKKKLAELDKTLLKAEETYNTAKKNRDFAQRCYATMNSSREEMLVEIRKQLIEEEETICPLCGQIIEKITDDFAGRLTELDLLRQEAEAQFSADESAWKRALKDQQTFRGALERKEKDLQSKETELRKQSVAIDKKALDMGLEAGEGLEQRIVTMQANLSEKEAGLKTTQKKAEDLQKQINALLKEKEPLQRSYDSARMAASLADQAVKDNETAIGVLKESFKQKETSKASLAGEISDALARFYPDWADGLPDIKYQIKADAEEYQKCKENVRTEDAELGALRDKLKAIGGFREGIIEFHADWAVDAEPVGYPCSDIVAKWRELYGSVGSLNAAMTGYKKTLSDCSTVLAQWYENTGRDEKALDAIMSSAQDLPAARTFVKKTEDALTSTLAAINLATEQRDAAMQALGAESEETLPAKADLEAEKAALSVENDRLVGLMTDINGNLANNSKNVLLLAQRKAELERTQSVFEKWNILNGYFGGSRFRTLVQTYILRPLLNNANIYLERITDRYKLTCSEENEQLSILVLDRYNKDQIRSVAVLSGGERFMISLALSLALSSLNRPDMNVNILFIDEGFGTLDAKTLESVMGTLEKLQEIAGESNRRVGIISHREELDSRVPTQIKVVKKGEGRSRVEIRHETE